MNQRERDARPVTVFGAGIAGLTVAHELATRGFKVQVIDVEYNAELHPRTPRGPSATLDRGIGGMARSQFAMRPGGSLGGGEMQRLWSGEELLLDKTITFHPEPDETGCARPLDPERARSLLDRLVATRTALVAAKLPASAIVIRVPTLTDDATNPQATRPSADARVAYLRRELASDIADLEPVIRRWDHPHPACCVYFAPQGAIVPAEHGFRFFPSFYRHLFDTMRRTRILNPRASERTKPTVFDNLVPTDELGFARAGAVRSFMVPRRATLSFEAIRKLLADVLGELEYTLDDIARFQLKLFTYMTSSTARRRREYEHVSWGAFLDSERYSPVSREHIEYGPQMSAALRGSQSDARTQGNITIQLMLDQLKSDALADYTLAGPTSGAWLDHWHDFLVDQDVEFARGELERFEVVDQQIRPVVNGTQATGTYFVLALSLPGMSRIAGSLIEAAQQARVPATELRDLERTLAFAGDLATDLSRACPEGPLQHLSGIQYYFDQEVRFWRGHTQYLDSAWGLTSIAQPQFWAGARRSSHGYRSILSVDIGIFDRAFDGKTAWECDADEIARRAWRQIQDHHDDAFTHKYGPDAVFPTPIAYALDAKLVLDPTGTRQNLSPFLVNRTSKFPTRPGKLGRDGESRCVSRYDVIAGRFVLAGTFMKTYTRLTSMEAANESARHAVNALLQAWNIGGDRCEIWDPEDHELEDLQWFKDVDEELVERGLPHFVDILGWRELPSQLVPDALRSVLPLRGRNPR